MKAGKVDESLTILKELSKNYPNEYALAANLGTAYELSGELDSALYYINKGMRLNPNAHSGSEWVHIKILETKKQLLNDSSYLKTRTVLELTPKQESDSTVRKQLEIQIRERFPFTPNHDEIMASLMIDLGDCYVKTLSIEHAKAFYTLATEYYGAPEKLTKEKIANVINLRSKYREVKPDRSKINTEGMHSKVNGVPYKTIIDNNNKDDYQINWEKLTTNPAELLSLVDLSITPPAPLSTHNQENQPKTDDNRENTEVEKNESSEHQESNSIIWIGLAILVIVSCLFLLFKKRK